MRRRSERYANSKSGKKMVMCVNGHSRRKPCDRGSFCQETQKKKQASAVSSHPHYPIFSLSPSPAEVHQDVQITHHDTAPWREEERVCRDGGYGVARMRLTDLEAGPLFLSQKPLTSSSIGGSGGGREEGLCYGERKGVELEGDVSMRLSSQQSLDD